MTEGICRKVQSASEICCVRIPSVSFADSIPTPIGPSGHFPLTGGIGPLCPRGALVHTNSPKIPVKSVYPAGGQSRPPLQRAGGRKRLVGADDSVGPKNVANSPGITVKTVRSAGPMWASAPTNARFGGSPKIAAFESPQSASLTAPLGHKGSLWRGLSNIKTSPHDRGEVSRGTTLIMLAHISALLYREAPAALSRGRSKLAADRPAEGLSPSPSL